MLVQEQRAQRTQRRQHQGRHVQPRQQPRGGRAERCQIPDVQARRQQLRQHQTRHDGCDNQAGD